MQNFKIICSREQNVQVYGFCKNNILKILTRFILSSFDLLYYRIIVKMSKSYLYYIFFISYMGVRMCVYAYHPPGIETILSSYHDQFLTTLHII